MQSNKYIRQQNTNDTINKNYTVYIIIGIILFRVSLDFVFVRCMVTIFGYTGMVLSTSTYKVVLSWIVLIFGLPIYLHSIDEESFSGLILFFLLLLSFVPFTTMIAYFDFSNEYVLANSIYWILLGLLIIYIPPKNIRIKIGSQTIQIWIWAITILFGISILYISGKYMGFRFVLNLSSVYQMRDEARELPLPTLLTYIFDASKAVNLVLIVYAMQKKRIALLISLIVIQILSFSINGSKTVLFSTVVTLVLYYVYKKKYLQLLPWMLSGLCILAYLEMELFKSININAYIIHRVFFFPNQLGYNYYDYFTTFQPDYFRQSFLRWFGFNSPYGELSHLIGEVYYSMPDMGANNGLISDAITNCGRIGVIIMPAILAFVLKAFDGVLYGVDRKVYIVPAVSFAFILLSSFLTTVLLTHGMAAVFLVFLLLSSENTINNDNNLASFNAHKYIIKG